MEGPTALAGNQKRTVFGLARGVTERTPLLVAGDLASFPGHTSPAYSANLMRLFADVDGNLLGVPPRDSTFPVRVKLMGRQLGRRSEGYMEYCAGLQEVANAISDGKAQTTSG